MKKVNFLLVSTLVFVSTACGNKTESAQPETNEAEAIATEEIISETETPSDESESSEQGDNNARVDKMLDDYEAIIDEYDMNSAMNMATKAQSMQKNPETMASEMNGKQTQRLTKLTSKLSAIAAKAATINTNDIKSVNGVDLENIIAVR